MLYGRDSFKCIDIEEFLSHERVIEASLIIPVGNRRRIEQHVCCCTSDGSIEQMRGHQLVKMVEEGTVDSQKVDAAVLRILKLKENPSNSIFVRYTFDELSSL